MKRSSADCAARNFSPDMLPLTSSTMPRLTGTRSLLKCEICCFCAVLAHHEVLLAEVPGEASRAVGHGGGDVDQLGGASEAEAVLRSQRHHGHCRHEDRHERRTKAGHDACVHGNHRWTDVSTKGLTERRLGNQGTRSWPPLPPIGVGHEAAVSRAEGDPVAAHVGMRRQFHGELRILAGPQHRRPDGRAAAAQHATGAIEQHDARDDGGAVGAGDGVAHGAPYHEAVLALFVCE